MYDFIKLSNFIQFKHIVSGPAPVGRILNYIKLAGKSNLKHVNGNRNLKLTNNIGSAWTIEFMFGLGIVHYDHNNKVQKDVHLTKSGERIFNLISNSELKFNEDFNILEVKREILSLGDGLIKELEIAFRNSVVFKNLKIYLDKNGYEQSFKKNKFLDDYFEALLKHYEGKNYDRNVRTSAGKNRVPSLIQLCQLFNYLEIENNIGKFKLLPKYKKDTEEYVDYNEEIIYLKESEKKTMIIVNEIVEKYGIDGNVTTQLVSRNSRIQQIFRNNLIIEFNLKCAICDKNLNELLIASHIKPAHISNVYEKLDKDNGLLLCANHDKLFDSNLISFDSSTGKLIYDSKIKNSLKNLDLHSELKLESKFLTQKRREFLKIHNRKMK